MDFVYFALGFLVVASFSLLALFFYMTFKMKTMPMGTLASLTAVCLGIIGLSIFSYVQHNLMILTQVLPILIIAFWILYGGYLKQQINRRLRDRPVTNRISR